MATSSEADFPWSLVEDFVEEARTICVGSGGNLDSRTQKFLDNVSVEKLFEILEVASQADNEEHVKLVSKALEFVFSAETNQRKVLHSDFLPYILGGIQHREVHVRLLTLKLVQTTGIDSFPVDSVEPILSTLVEALRDPDTSVSINTTELILKFAEGKTPAASERNNLEIVLQKMSKLVLTLKQSAGDTSTSLLRVFHIVATLSARGEEELKVCQASGALDPLLDLVGSDDVLLQLNALNLIPLVAVTDSGFELLVQSNVVNRLCEMAGISELGSGTSPFLGDYSLKIMSQLSARALGTSLSEGVTNQKLADKFLQIVSSRIGHCIESRDPTEGATLLLALGFFVGAQPAESIREILLDSRAELVQNWIHLCNMTGEKFQIAGLESLAKALRGGSVVSNHSEYHGTDDLDKLQASLSVQKYGKITGNSRKKAAELGRELVVLYGRAYGLLRSDSGKNDSIGILFDLVRVPIDDIRCAAYSVLRMIAGQDAEWALSSLFAHPETTAVLFDRSLEMSKAAKEWRFSVMEAIRSNPHCANLGKAITEKIDNFLKKGPFAGPPGRAVAAAVKMEVR